MKYEIKLQDGRWIIVTIDIWDSWSGEKRIFNQYAQDDGRGYSDDYNWG